jgi:hypothetical protein
MPLGRVHNLLVKIGTRAYQRPLTKKLFNAAAKAIGVIGRRIPGYAYSSVRAELGYNIWKNQRSSLPEDQSLGDLHAGIWATIWATQSGRLGSTTPMGSASIDQSLFYRLIGKLTRRDK